MTGESLLDEIKGTPPAYQSAEPQTHRTPTPQIDRTDTPADMHTIPHTKSPQIDAQPIDSIEEKEQVATLPDETNNINKDAQVIDSEGKEVNKGVGVSIFTEEDKGKDTETPPVTVWKEKV